MKSPGHVWLLGLSGSGKSTLGPILARKLGIPFADTDQLISHATGCSISEIFLKEGEKEFRQHEARVLAEVAAGKPSVISCGGGIILDPSNRKTMARTGTRVYLQVALPILIARLTPSADRPLLPKNQRSVLLARQLSERETWYAESEIKIEAGSGTPEETACRILDQLPPS